jgi:hypothetical protein
MPMRNDMGMAPDEAIMELHFGVMNDSNEVL